MSPVLLTALFLNLSCYTSVGVQVKQDNLFALPSLETTKPAYEVWRENLSNSSNIPNNTIELIAKIKF